MTSDLRTENERLRLEISNLKKLVIRLYNNITKARAYSVVESPDGLASCPLRGHDMKEMHMNFGEALQELKRGNRVARSGWNGKGMWLIFVPGTKDAKLKEGTPYHDALQIDHCEILPHIDMWTVDSNGRQAMLPGWLASQTDMLSEDWCVIAQ